LDAGVEVSLDVAKGRGVWIQAARGKIRVLAGEWTDLEAGDGAAFQDEPKLVIRAETAAELLTFDLA
jgi:redox-sensitive bicupin YhaK (pirin superfamily)